MMPLAHKNDNTDKDLFYVVAVSRGISKRTVMLTELDKAITAHVCAVIPECDAIYIYGSFGSGEQRDDSDIDIAILVDRPITADQVLELKERLGVDLRRDIDILDLERSHLEIAFQATHESRRIFS